MKRLTILMIIMLCASVCFSQQKTKKLRVPDVMGLKASGAKLILERAGLKTATVVITEKGNPGTVIKLMVGKTEIKPWSSVPHGTTVLLGIVKEDLVKVPEVTGKSEEEASKILEKKDLKLGNVQKKATTEAKPGIIIVQKPKKGTEVEKKTIIQITVAEPVMITVPDLLGKTDEDVRKMLNETQLVLGQVTDTYSDNTPGTVIEQDPAAGMDVVISSKISVVVAKEKKVSVPSLRNKTKSEAWDLLEKVGLKLGKVDEQIDTRTRVGSVINQSPNAYAQVSKGTSVDIVLAKRDMVDLPSVIGLKQSDALRLTKGLGFQTSVQTWETTTEPAGIVIKMLPSAGKHEKGTQVTLTVSKEKPKPKPIPEPIQKSIEPTSTATKTTIPLANKKPTGKARRVY